MVENFRPLLRSIIAGNSTLSIVFLASGMGRLTAKISSPEFYIVDQAGCSSNILVKIVVAY